MQIRVVFGGNDPRYLDNITRYLEKNYRDKLEVRSFSSPELLESGLRTESADVILLEEDFGISAETLAGQGAVAYLCDNAEEEMDDGIRRIVKFKKPDLLYQDILNLYAGNGSSSIFHGNHSGNQSIILVTGFSGGTGASTFAAALAKKYAAKGKKTLYLNLEPIGSSSVFFAGDGAYQFEEVIFALKSQRADVALKLQSSVRRDRSGVYYFEPCSSMYMLELHAEEHMKLLRALRESDYEVVVVDKNMQLTKEFVELMAVMDRVLLVQDGSDTSNDKVMRSIEVLKIMQEQTKKQILPKMELIYNKFSSSKSSSEISNLPFPVIGKIPPIKHAASGEIMEYMLTLTDIFERL